MQNGANFRFISPVLGGLGIGGDGKNAPKKPATPRRSSFKSRVFNNKSVNRSDICIAGAAVGKIRKPCRQKYFANIVQYGPRFCRGGHSNGRKLSYTVSVPFSSITKEEYIFDNSRFCVHIDKESVVTSGCTRIHSTKSHLAEEGLRRAREPVDGELRARLSAASLAESVAFRSRPGRLLFKYPLRPYGDLSRIKRDAKLHQIGIDHDISLGILVIDITDSALHIVI